MSGALGCCKSATCNHKRLEGVNRSNDDAVVQMPRQITAADGALRKHAPVARAPGRNAPKQSATTGKRRNLATLQVLSYAFCILVGKVQRSAWLSSTGLAKG